MKLLRRAVLGVADQPRVQRAFTQNSRARDLVNRFVAGDTVEDALNAANQLAQDDIKVTLDLLGENTASREAAGAASESYISTLRKMREQNLEPNISVKPTMLGMDFGDDVFEWNIVPILEAARDVEGFVRIDMEGSAYTERTMNLFSSLHERFPENVGIVIQSYLHRASQDVVDMINRNARVRLVKGAYAEPESVAIQSSSANDENYVKLAHHLLDQGNFPAIATHDPNIIENVIEYSRAQAIAPDTWEFQMLYGVRRAEQVRLRKAGFGMRVYVPFGTEWYPYFTRRIAERPANSLFVLRQMLDRS